MKRLILAAAGIFLASSAFAGTPLERTEVPDVSSLAHSASPERAKLGLLLEKSLGAYENVRDYEAIFLKKELEGGAMGEEEKIYLKFEKPFKIFLGWLNTKKKGLQVHYERGKHGGKLAIHKPGLLLGLAPVIFLDQSSPYVRAGSESYDIEDAGIGTFLYDFGAAASAADREGKLEVKFIGEDGTVEVRFPGTEDAGVYFAGRIVARFDKTTHLPVYMELYDWKDKPTGVYSYQNLAINVGSDGPAFKKQIDRHLYRVYRSKD